MVGRSRCRVLVRATMPSVRRCWATCSLGVGAMFPDCGGSARSQSCRRLDVHRPATRGTRSDGRRSIVAPVNQADFLCRSVLHTPPPPHPVHGHRPVRSRIVNVVLFRHHDHAPSRRRVQALTSRTLACGTADRCRTRPSRWSRRAAPPTGRSARSRATGTGRRGRGRRSPPSDRSRDRSRDHSDRTAPASACARCAR